MLKINHKKILLFFLVLMLFVVGGCSSSGSDTVSNNAQLLIKVVDANNNALAEAKVEVTDVGSKTTDAEGTVQFTGLKEQKYEVEVIKTGYGSSKREILANSEAEVTSFKLEESSPSQLSIVDSKEYIDITNTEVKFLFQTEVGNQVNLYLGTSKDKLEKVKSIANYSNEGLFVDGLTGGTKYYYQIEAINGETTTKTEVLSFTKLAETNNWEPASWAKDAVFYEVFVRSFYDSDGDGIGDFNGLKEKIPYFKELGVDALWLMPINDSPSYHGYDVVDYKDTNPDYGTKEEFQAFLEAAHNKGIKVIMDLVVNHSSTQHNWFVEAAQGENNKYRDYYIWEDKFTNLDEPHPWQGDDASAWHNASAPDYYYGVFWDQMPDLNFRNQQVRQEMKEVAKYWLDPDGDGDFSDGVDGFRLDAALHIDDKDPQVTHNWWQEFNTAVKSVNPDAFLVGENWTDTATMAKYFEDLDSSFNFPLADGLLYMSDGNEIDILSYLNSIHSEYASYSNDFIDSTFLRNHDQPRTTSVLGNHEKSKLAASLLLTMPGTPFIYYGEEIGQVGYNVDGEPDQRVREPFDWYADAIGIGMTTDLLGKFTTKNDSISVAEQRGERESIFEHYKKLISIRKDYPAFSNIDNYTNLDLINLYGYQVSGGSDNLYIVHNNTSNSYNLSISNSAIELLTEKSYTATDSILIDDYETVILKTTSSLDIETTEITEKVAHTFNYDPEGTVDNVVLAGEFNNWDEQATVMTDTDGDYQATIDLIPGDYEYKFVVDGEWIVDPDAEYYVPDMNGGKNSAVNIK